MIIDAGVVDRLEASAAELGAALATAMIATSPHRTARVRRLGTGALVALGPGRYVNRALGVTLDGLTDGDLDLIEAFFIARYLAPAIEVCSWAPTELVARLAGRGYRPGWFRNVYVRDIDDLPPIEPTPSVSIVAVGDELRPGWMAVLADGNEIDDAAARATSDEFAIAAAQIQGSTDYVTLIDGAVAGCGSLQIDRQLGWVGAAATAPAFRRAGVQTALLRHRLHQAAALGCDQVAASALPAGTSARNLQRHGFTLAYTEVVVTRPAD